MIIITIRNHRQTCRVRRAGRGAVRRTERHTTCGGVSDRESREEWTSRARPAETLRNIGNHGDAIDPKRRGFVAVDARDSSPATVQRSPSDHRRFGSPPPPVRTSLSLKTSNVAYASTPCGPKTLRVFDDGSRLISRTADVRTCGPDEKDVVVINFSPRSA